MERTLRLRKFNEQVNKLKTSLVFNLFYSCLFCLFLSDSLLAKEKNLPPLLKAAILPSKIDEKIAEEHSFLKDKLRSLYVQSLESTKRFIILNTKLVDEMWKNKKGRDYLVENEDINLYAQINLNKDREYLILSIQLLDLHLNIFLLESLRIPKKAFLKLADKKLLKKIKELVYILINKLPIDLTVTSVQKDLITLAGNSHKLEIGKDLLIVRPTVTDLHPALKTWRKFKTRSIAKIKILAFKNDLIIAKTTGLFAKQKIQIGDGSFIKESPYRSYFSKRGEEKKSKKKSP